MLSRRSVRIKVMQLLYAKSTDESLTQKASEQRYNRMIEQSYDVFLFTLFTIIQVTKIASDDETKKKAKHLPTEADKIFSAKLCDNDLIRSLRDNPDLNKSFEKKSFNAITDRDLIKKVYFQFTSVIRANTTYSYELGSRKTRLDRYDFIENGSLRNVGISHNSCESHSE